MNTLNITVRRAVTMSVLGGAAVLTAAPACAAVAPESPAAVAGAPQSKAQVEHAEEKYIHDSRTGFGEKAQVNRMEREAHPQSVPQPVGETSDPSDPSSVPVTLLALLGGTLVAGAAGYTVYRFRHHGPVGAATA